MTWQIQGSDVGEITWMEGTGEIGPDARADGIWYQIGTFGSLGYSLEDDNTAGQPADVPIFTVQGVFVMEVREYVIGGRLKSAGRRFKTPAQVPI